MYEWKDLCHSEYYLTAINTDMNGRVCGALVQFGCYQYRYERKGLWCSNTVRLLSTLNQIRMEGPVVL